MTFRISGIQPLQHWWKDLNWRVGKINLIWSHSMRVSWSTCELFSRPVCECARVLFNSNFHCYFISQVFIFLLCFLFWFHFFLFLCFSSLILSFSFLFPPLFDQLFILDQTIPPLLSLFLNLYKNEVRTCTKKRKKDTHKKNTFVVGNIDVLSPLFFFFFFFFFFLLLLKASLSKWTLFLSLSPRLIFVSWSHDPLFLSSNNIHKNKKHFGIPICYYYFKANFTLFLLNLLCLFLA